MDRKKAVEAFEALLALPKAVKPQPIGLPHDIRLARASRTKGRFEGRAELFRKAERGDLEALACLEKRLGLITVEQYWADLNWRAKQKGGERLRPLGMVRADLRTALQRALRSDELGHRKEGWARRRLAEKRVKERYDSADFRVARHSHSVRFVLVNEGHEGALSDTGKAWPDDVGLPKAYKYRVATSSHVVHYSVAILRAPEPSHHCLPLSPTVTILQGRGSSLTCVRKGGK